MEKKHGIFGWNELMTTDVQGAKDFYSRVIGWTSHDVKMGDPTKAAEPGEASYTLWTIGDMQVGGAMKLEGPGMDNVPPHWMCYVSVAEVDKVVEKAKAHGGKVIAGPMDIEKIGRFYIIADPQGAVLGLGSSTMEDD